MSKEDFKEYDISDEQWREYSIAVGDVVVNTRINNPVKLFITKNKIRIIDKEGICHWVPSYKVVGLRWFSPTTEKGFAF